MERASEGAWSAVARFELRCGVADGSQRFERRRLRPGHCVVGQARARRFSETTAAARGRWIEAVVGDVGRSQNDQFGRAEFEAHASNVKVSQVAPVHDGTE